MLKKKRRLALAMNSKQEEHCFLSEVACIQFLAFQMQHWEALHHNKHVLELPIIGFNLITFWILEICTLDLFALTLCDDQYFETLGLGGKNQDHFNFCVRTHTHIYIHISLWHAHEHVHRGFFFFFFFCKG